ncbi:MAG: nucleotidyltransferase family protein [Paludibacteraceae bacterium]|nr:nucleotidyltransferase family protein [Paludibacteraceae bacterium]
MRAMIFAAGLGTRLKPLTDTLPKALVPLAGKTLLQWQIERLKAAGITDIVVNVHHFPDMIINYLRENDNFGCRIAVSDERDMLLETGGGLRKAKSLLLGIGSRESGNNDEPILICNVDILSNIDLPTLLQTYNPEEMGVVVVSPRDTQRYLLFDETNRLCGWTNIATGEVRPASLVSSLNILPPTGEADLQAKPTYQLQRSDLSPLAFSGMQVLNPRIFDVMDKVVAEKGDKFSLIDLYLSIAEKEILRAFIPENYRMMDVGKIAQLSEAESFAASL